METDNLEITMKNRVKAVDKMNEWKLNKENT